MLFFKNFFCQVEYISRVSINANISYADFERHFKKCSFFYLSIQDFPENYHLQANPKR